MDPEIEVSQHLAEPDGQRVVAGDGPGGLERPCQRTGVDDREGLTGHAVRQGCDLGTAYGVQPSPALDPALSIELGPAMAHENKSNSG